MKTEYSAKEFKELFDSGKIKVSKKRFKMDSNELLLPNDTLPTQSTNKRVRNAKTVEYDGLKFDSALNLEIYKFLKENSVRFESEVKYELQPSFRKHGKSYRPITWTADYYLPDYNVIIEGKGYATDRYKIVSKIFAFKYDIKVYEIKNKKEVILINEIIKNKSI